MAMKSMEGLGRRAWLLIILVLGVMSGYGVPLMVSADNTTYGSGTYGNDLYNGSGSTTTQSTSTTSTSSVTGGGVCVNCDTTASVATHLSSSSGSTSSGGAHSTSSVTTVGGTSSSTPFLCPDRVSGTTGLSTAGLVNLFVSLGIIPQEKAQKACDALSSPTATGTNTSNTSFRFVTPLKIGSRNADVKRLQVFLNTYGFVIVANGPGSPGNETDYYGTLTAAAVKRFQAAYKAEILTPVGLTLPSGIFGPSSMKKANALLGSN